MHAVRATGRSTPLPTLRSALSPSEWGLLVVLIGWSLIPLALIERHARLTGQRWTGGDGPFGADQLQYLAWIRDSGTHVLASNLFDLAPPSHVFLHPLFLLAGILWRLGLSLPLVLLVFKPLAIAVMFAGSVAYVRRLLDPGAGRTAALALSLFYLPPLAAVFTWLDIGSTGLRGALWAPLGQTTSAGQMWGYVLSAISLGLMPLCLLSSERAIRTTPTGQPRRWVAAAALCAAMASWLHPWQGVVLALLFGGLIAWSGSRRDTMILIWPFALAVLPVAYYFGLSHLDTAWRTAAQQNRVGHYPTLGVVFALLPLAAPAALALRRRVAELQERALLLWPLAALVAYAISPSFPGHALIGIATPLSILAVRGWRRMHLPRAAGVVAVIGLTIPGSLYPIGVMRELIASGRQGSFIEPAEERALRWVDRQPGEGGVLAKPGLSAKVPALTGRRVWVGHLSLTPDYVARARQAERLFANQLPPAEARRLIENSGAALVVTDCESRLDVDRGLQPPLRVMRRFGCATVYGVE